MIYAVYIAAAAVIGLLIGFVALSVGWLKKTVLRSIRSKTLGLIAVYDELLEEKSQELAESDKRRHTEKSADQKEQPAASVTAGEPAPLPPTAFGAAKGNGQAEYRDGSVGSIYRTIRKNFSFHVEEILSDLKRGKAEPAGSATRLLEALDYDTVYQLSTLQPAQQLAIMQEVLAGDTADLLEPYLAEGKTFRVLEFYDSLRALADAEPKPVKLRLPADFWSEKKLIEGVEVIPDREICEGFQVEENQVLYDYCIKARELV